MQALQAVFLSPQSQAELFVCHDRVNHAMPRYRLLLHEAPGDHFELSVSAVLYPEKVTGGAWGNPVHAEPHRHKTFAGSTELLTFLDELGLPRSWQPINDEASVNVEEDTVSKA